VGLLALSPSLPQEVVEDSRGFSSSLATTEDMSRNEKKLENVCLELKGIVHPKFLPFISHPHVFPNLKDFCLSEHK